MSEKEYSFVTYTKKHEEIVESGINSISEILNGTEIKEKRSLLFCLDKYLDPYYGYSLPYSDDIFLLLQQQLFIKNDKEVKEDIFQLLTGYSNSLDYLAEKIDEIESEFLADAIYALGLNCSKEYIPIFIRYENHENPIVQNNAKQALIELAKLEDFYKNKEN